jgi:hypothetical protein
VLFAVAALTDKQAVGTFKADTPMQTAQNAESNLFFFMTSDPPYFDKGWLTSQPYPNCPPYRTIYMIIPVQRSIIHRHQFTCEF